MGNKTVRLSQAQFGRTLFLLGVGMGTNPQGQGEYARLCDALADNTPRSGELYELSLTGTQQEQIQNGLQAAQSAMGANGPAPGWFNDLETVWGIRAAAGSR